MKENVILEINKLSYNLPNSQNNLFFIENLTIKKSDKLLIKGLSGKGKTTLLHLMGGLINQFQGNIHLLGRNLASISQNELNEIRKNKCTFIFQKLNLISHMTPMENLELVAPHSSEYFDKAEAFNILKELNLENQAHTVSGRLSTGEQQRVACARAIFANPEIIFADEPTSSLDDVNTKKVIELLLKKIPSVTLIAVAHDHRLEEYFDQIIQFEDMIS